MSLSLTLAGERLTLLPDRAIYWPRRRTLLVADVHLGKGAALRRAGVAVPQGTTQDNLTRLARLVSATGAERLLVLGDFFHTRVPADDPVIAAFDAFRARHHTLGIEVLRGNHDRAVERHPPHWALHWHCDAHVEPPFVWRHEPEPDTRGYVLAGHIHPVLRLRDGRDTARLPVFWFSPGRQLGVLPSFGALTGGHAVTPAAGDTLVAVTPDGLVSL